MPDDFLPAISRGRARRHRHLGAEVRRGVRAAAFAATASGRWSAGWRRRVTLAAGERRARRDQPPARGRVPADQPRRAGRGDDDARAPRRRRAAGGGPVRRRRRRRAAHRLRQRRRTCCSRAAPAAPTSWPCAAPSARAGRRLVGAAAGREPAAVPGSPPPPGWCWRTAAARLLARLGPRDIPWVDTLHVDAGALAFAAGLAGAGRPSSPASLPALAAGRPGQLAPPRTINRRPRPSPAADGPGSRRSGPGHRARLRRRAAAAELRQPDARRHRLRPPRAWRCCSCSRGIATPGRIDCAPSSIASIDRVEALPGVEAAGAVSAMPFIDASIEMRSLFQIVGDPAPAPGEEPRGALDDRDAGILRRAARAGAARPGARRAATDLAGHAWR